MTRRLTKTLEELLAAGEPVVLVTVAMAEGSTPREAGACMAVTAEAAHGTIGGGRMEWEAIGRARDMIAGGLDHDSFDMPLGPAVGQCCGGRVMLDLARAGTERLAALRSAESAAEAQRRKVLVFGAGHVGKALTDALSRLPLRVIWSDERRDIFPAEIPDSVQAHGGDPVELIRQAEPLGAAVVLTHSHALDYAITEAALERDDLAYVGLIGSRTKRRRFERWFTARGGDGRKLDQLVCPIGDFGVVDKRPEVIAALAAAEIVAALARAEAQASGLSEAGRSEGAL